MLYAVHHFKSLTSTQDKAKEFAKISLSNIIIFADEQTKGRGRLKRRWHSSKEGLWISILVKPKNIENMQCLTFAAAIAVVKSIKKIAGLSTNIKWPNDVHYKGKKLCGILTEGIFAKENHIVVGIGLNINQNSFPDEIKGTATSLKIITKKNFDRNFFLKSVADEFFFLYKNFYEKNKSEKILKLWKEHCDTIGKNVAVITKTKKINGMAVGIDKDCSLLLKLKNGSIVKIIEGDLSVRF